jgi:hypothetical protein
VHILPRVQSAETSQLQGLFETTLSGGAPVRSGTFAVGGRRLAVRCVGRAHWGDLDRSLLRGDDGLPDISLDVWDVDEARLRPARTAPEESALAEHGELLAFSPGARELRHVGSEFDMLFDTGDARATGWVSSARIQAWHRLRPWQRIFVAALAASGAETVHGSMVARDGRGALLVGPSGVGKSTTTFACLAAGFACLGDDTIAIDLGAGESGAPRGSCVHATAKVDVDQLARFPAFEAESDLVDDPSRSERALRLGGRPSALVTASATVAAIAFPRLAETRRSTTRQIPRSHGAAGLFRNALSIDGERFEPVFATMTALAEAVPSYTLEVGRDPAGLAAAVEGLLAHPA